MIMIQESFNQSSNSHNPDESDTLLEIKGLTVEFQTPNGSLLANKNIYLKIGHGKTLGIVGESGSGKSVLCRSILRLLPNPPAVTRSGEIWYRGVDLVKVSEQEMRLKRGTEIAMIFQDPMSCLNPVYRIGDQLIESLKIHKRLIQGGGREIGINLLRKVGIPSPEKRIDSFPHQLSGGMRQRVMIAMAISTQPNLLLADEPTTALDVTIQDQILALLLDLQSQVGMSIILVSHDMGIVAETSDEVVVMYAGQIMEQGSTEDIFNRPQHPYTAGLLNSIPNVKGAKNRLIPIQGQPPNLLRLPDGCPFFERCSIANPGICDQAVIKLNEVETGHFSSCLYPHKLVK
jgi:oligopeptide/dipeptide ABC transporter ATP-binding protein